ncbi:MAG: four-carbon acid sugar kinase family protein [Firmicutes bacterium]|nr:four-carbon acid sugar kinase family protein [Bacillota bacterium]
MEGIHVNRAPAIGVIADDLTGAGDTGVQFVAKGLEVSVLFCPEAPLGATDGIVLDTDSRTLAPTAAAKAVSQAVRWLKEQGTKLYYKKIDSTLRGNVGSEVQAALDESGLPFAVIAPAYPKMGRATEGGIHYVKGVPVHETEVARDPRTPVTESDLSRLLTAQTGEKTMLFPRGSGEDWAERLANCRKKGIRLLIFDAATDEDLVRIVQQLRQHAVLWVGSAGLAEHLLPALGEEKREELPETRGPVLTVSGSMSQVTQRQVKRMLQEPGTEILELDPTRLLFADPPSLEDAMERAGRVLKQGRDLVIYVGSGDTTGAKPAGWNRAEAGERIVGELGKLAGEVIRQNQVERLILTGGDTAKSVCRHIGAQGLTLKGEVEPGLPIGTLLGGPSGLAVTKAGAFGSDVSLVEANHRLKGTKVYE